jgi:hypothetical protein
MDFHIRQQLYLYYPFLFISNPSKQVSCSALPSSQVDVSAFDEEMFPAVERALRHFQFEVKFRGQWP